MGYTGPRRPAIGHGSSGINVTIIGGDRQNFAQASGPCTDTDSNKRDDYNGVPCDNGSDYSVQFFVKSDESSITITVTWASPYADLGATYTLDSDVNKSPDGWPHTSQEEWP